ncbi:MULTISPECIES: hypothetical protein [Achromobacter]|uniref:Uncharacterized protein n=1 Tax=Achromobacter spanius TaxID=217203 RepID=A0AAW3HXS2_9BURK|nr:MULTISPECIES: hypothetical protein [Achromobacter]AZS80109.1 hypothetical protein ELS24_17590 [Achromobacter spanius]KNE24626.1 hypothetical protein AFM18_24735 [Achromobacter spanius]MCD0501084.1 hypothetical protein [Achromobacter sp. MY14]MCW3154855.1 hypothetical protein [Achromobacter spanius]
MTNRDEFLTSEIRELERMLEDIPASAAIQRISIQNRLKTVRAALKSELASPQPSRVKLTFRGRPTIGSHGIAADFGGKATTAFADAFAAVVAGLNENLQLMGPIPDRDKNQLLITGTAVGSFGFEFELPAGGLFPEHEKTEDALQKMQSLLEASATGSDDDVAEFVDAIHPRAVKKISEFLSVLFQYHAWCGLEFKGRIFRYEGFDQLTHSASRLGEENIQEASESFAGEFVGILPNSRTFEFQTEDGLIKGRIGASIADPDVILRDWLKRSVQITLAVVQVGQGRPRFTLNALPK